MNKCSNCQTEFDGDVCPSCSSKDLNKKKTTISNKTYNILKFIPAIGFATFIALMIVFMMLPVAKVDAFGLDEKYGSIFSGERFDEILGLNSLSIAVMVVLVAAVLHLLPLLINRFTSAKYAKIAGKPSYKTLNVVSLAFILVFLVLASMVARKVCLVDDGLNIIKVGAFSVLTIIFSIICFVGICTSMVLCSSYEKANPQILEEWEAEYQKVVAESKNMKANKAVKTYSKKSAKFIILPIVLFTMILMGNTTLLSNIVGRFQIKSFDASDLKKSLTKDAGKFELTKYDIELLIGKSYVPEGATEDANDVVYYTDSYIEMLGKLERNQKYGLLAIENGDKRISKLLKQAQDLSIEQEILVYGQAEIAYNNSGFVTEVVYDNVVIDSFSSVEKKLDKVEIYQVVEVVSGQDTTKHKVDEVRYLATYKDGSYIYGSSRNVMVVLEDDVISSTYEGSYVGKTLKWQDQFGTYEVVAPANKN